MRRIVTAGVLTLSVALLAGCSDVATTQSASVARSAAVATDTDAVTHAQNDRVPEGARWTQHYFPTADGVELHADVLLPEDLPEGAKVPLVMSAGGYFGHSGQLSVEGFAHTGPSARFEDLIAEGGLLERGYGLVMVDSRGSGGSTGCTEAIGGPADQADIRAALDWAAAQPWSTGSVGMYGKSLDGVTALVGNNLEHPALKAVIAQEPIWDIQRNMRSGGVPRSTITSVPTVYNEVATQPQMPDDDPRYLANAAWDTPTGPHPECPLLNTASYMEPNPESETWTVRDLAERAKGTTTPLFLTQGFLEWNTEAEGMAEFLANHEGPQRAWLGQWDHKRGGERTADGRLELGREGWFDEVFSFYDQYLKGVQPAVQYPAVAVEDSTGSWRAEDSWPRADRTATVRLGGGTYTDDGATSAFVQRSEPVAAATRLTGTPTATVTARGTGNVMVRLHDVAPDGSGTMINQQVSVLRAGETRLQLKSMDWTLPAGHSLAVDIGTVQPGIPLTNDWLPSVSNQEVTVQGARLDLALDDPAKDSGLPGSPAPWSDLYRQSHVSAPAAGAPSFRLP
ncbi:MULTISPECIES: CocE/NonD family hydrolase [unclassified Pseudonocardia]|uniref:CocE/NonD family hydrolase n=1 Tax=unclassified Pseudonocardia TaxID=2619320 RepID=UPI002016A0E4|nr:MULTISPECIES: CocE/NonD family hydrolase [unclassified Pseudonocardia]